jgi:Pentapeptide repeats (8 copies)
MPWREWLGVGERRWKKAPDEEVQPAKTLWDWLQLLIVPAILIGVTFAWSASQTRSNNKRDDRRIAADRAAAEEARQDATLQSYLDQMSGLMLDKKLLTSTQLSAVRAVARTVTLAALRRLDGERKAAVVRFLNEVELVKTYEPDDPIDSPVVVLQKADLSGADLRGAELSGAELSGVDLTDAEFSGADLNSARLVSSRLRHAQLSRATLDATDLRNADLTGADLSDAYLPDTNLGGAHLKGANLSGADLVHAKFMSNDAIYGRLLAHDLDLDAVITDLPSDKKKEFLRVHKALLDSLSPAELAMFNLSPEKLARFRREASGPESYGLRVQGPKEPLAAAPRPRSISSEPGSLTRAGNLAAAPGRSDRHPVLSTSFCPYVPPHSYRGAPTSCRSRGLPRLSCSSSCR